MQMISEDRNARQPFFLDSTCLVRLHFEDAGYEGVRHLAASDFVACAQHGRAEVISAFHRKFQERAISARLYEITLREFLNETRGGACRCLPLSERVFERAELVYARLPATIFLRAVDALHLSTASHGFRDIHSNDTKLLSAAPHFGLRGLNVIDYSGPRMCISVRFLETFDSDVRVDLCGGKTRVPE